LQCKFRLVSCKAFGTIRQSKIGMKYHRLHINTDNKAETFNEITKILGCQPTMFESKRNPNDKYGTWTYSVDENEKEEGPGYDFINKFLDIIEPKFNELEKLGIKRSDIVFWFTYEYLHQCSMEFHPQEMKRLGDSGVVMSIDCFQKKTN
jgi:hypothetical protein